MRASLVGDACSDPKEDPIPSQAGFAVLEKKRPKAPVTASNVRSFSPSPSVPHLLKPRLAAATSSCMSTLGGFPGTSYCCTLSSLLLAAKWGYADREGGSASLDCRCLSRHLRNKPTNTPITINAKKPSSQCTCWRVVSGLRRS